jgi:hypothetical protein
MARFYFLTIESCARIRSSYTIIVNESSKVEDSQGTEHIGSKLIANRGLEERWFRWLSQSPEFQKLISFVPGLVFCAPWVMH